MARLWQTHAVEAITLARGAGCTVWDSTGRPYLDLVAFSLIPLIIFQALKQFSEGLSRTKYPMYATILANVINIVLNYLLIFGALGFPRLGIVGAAIGTLVSRIGMVLFLWLLIKKRPVFKDKQSQIKQR